MRPARITAKADHGGRFHASWDKVLRSDVLWRGCVAVRANNGAPSVERAMLDWIETEYGMKTHLNCPCGESIAGTDEEDLVEKRPRSTSPRTIRCTSTRATDPVHRLLIKR
jgi:hypothetical protein